jgi:hypothetical protein
MMKLTDKFVAPGVVMSLSAIYNKKLNKQAAEVVVVVRKAMPILRKLLKLPKDVTIRVAPIKARNTNGRYFNGERMAEIDCRLDWAKALEVLCHEMVHAEQYHTGRLEKTWVSRGWTHVWNGSISFNKGTTYKAYRDQPWELEAWERQAALAEQVCTILENQ